MDSITVFGGSGFLGRRLISGLKSKYDFVIASRNAAGKNTFPSGIKKAVIDGTLESYTSAINGSAAVINFSGASIAGKRWNSEYKKEIYNSRIGTTEMIVSAIEKCSSKPSVFISTSASGYYGDRADEILNEESGAGSDFLADLCSDWEKAAFRARDLNVRTVCIRIGIVLDKYEGALKELIFPFRLFAGGKLGNGRQWMPWIHIDDVTGIISFALNNASITGPVNTSSPNPSTNRDFSKLTGKIMRRPAFFAVPKFALGIITGEFGKYLLAGQRMHPEKILKTGYKFRYEKLFDALNNLLN